MAYRKSTLRTMSPTARKVARLTGELESVARRLKNQIPELQRLDLDSQALKTAKQGVQLPDTDWEQVYNALEKLLAVEQTKQFCNIKEFEACENLHAELKKRPLLKQAF